MNMKTQWTPVKRPPPRRIQIVAVALFLFAFLVLPVINFLMLAFLLVFGHWIFKALLIPYAVYIYFDHTLRHSYTIGNGWLYLRSNFMWRHFRDYFPIKLVKTTELSPDRNYLLACFPHGIIGTGILNNMGSDIRKWLKLFPGIRPKIATLDQHFCVPITREILGYWGMISVSNKSLLHCLSRSNDPEHIDNRDGYTANAVAVLVGGAEESMDARPGRYILTLKHRKGFVKLAIMSGCPIVPCFSFGEVDIFDQVDNPPESLLRRCQNLMKSITRVSPVLVTGRGFFSYSFGFLPHRKPIVQVVGAPIEVRKYDNPDPAYVDEIHQKFMNALDELFEKYKAKYIQHSEGVKLIMH